MALRARNTRGDARDVRRDGTGAPGHGPERDTRGSILPRVDAALALAPDADSRRAGRGAAQRGHQGRLPSRSTQVRPADPGCAGLRLSEWAHHDGDTAVWLAGGPAGEDP